MGSLEESRLGNISEGPDTGIGKRNCHGNPEHGTNGEDAGSSDCKVNSYSLEDTKSTWVDKDAVLLTYKASQDAVCASQKLPSAVWASSLWVKKGSEWKAAFHQETPVQNSMGAEEKKN